MFGLLILALRFGPQALMTLMREQSVDYDFEVYMLPQPADVAVTVISSGQSIFKDAVPMRLPLRPVAPLGTCHPLWTSMSSRSGSPSLRTPYRCSCLCGLSLPFARLIIISSCHSNFQNVVPKQLPLRPVARLGMYRPLEHFLWLVHDERTLCQRRCPRGLLPPLVHLGVRVVHAAASVI